MESSNRTANVRAADPPARTCVVCRRTAAKQTLVRLALVEGGVAVGAKLGGRGAYVCCDAECLEGALQQDGARLARALRSGRCRVEPARLRAEWAAESAGRQVADASAAPARSCESEVESATVDCRQGVCE